MKLYHNTEKKNIENIKKYGLLADKNKKIGTEKASICLEDFKPASLPEYIQLDKCIYLTPGNIGYVGGGYVNDMWKGTNEILVLSTELDNKKLYYASMHNSQKITSLLNDAFHGEIRREKLTTMMESDYYKNLCYKYWKSFRPFFLYAAKYVNKQSVQDNVEVLYFDNIPPDKLKFV